MGKIVVITNKNGGLKMKFKQVDVNTFKGYKETKIQKTLADFIDQNIPVAEVVLDEGEYKSISSAYSAIKSGINRMKHGNIETRVKNKRLFLINNVLYESAVDTLQKERFEK